MKFPAKYWIPCVGLAALVVTEGTLRLALGLGNPVLSQADSYTGYRFQPNQKLHRFGKRIEYNQYSQRSEAIAKQKPQGTIRILMVGDSVLNGGSPTDQSQIITEILETKFRASGKPVEVLNASAGSWAIENRLGYLREFGTFDSDVVILQIGTEDLTQPTSTSDKVGHHPNFPNHPPLSAIQEALTNYILPKFAVSQSNSSSKLNPAVEATNLNQQFQKNMEFFKAAVALVRAKQIPVYVLYTPYREDLIPTPKTLTFKLKFMQMLNSLQVEVFDTYEAWSKLPTTDVEKYFRDEIHINEVGNKAAANLIFQQLCINQKYKGCPQ